MTKEILALLSEVNNHSYSLYSRLFDEISILSAEPINNCHGCKYLDMPHVREPASPCCQLYFDKNGFWFIVDPDKDYCNRKESNESNTIT